MSPSATAEGATESTSTPRDEYDLDINTAARKGNTLKQEKRGSTSKPELIRRFSALQPISLTGQEIDFARIGEKDFVVGYVVKEDVNGNRYYDHEMTVVIDPAKLESTSGAASHGEVGRPNTPQGRILNILREILGVNDGTASVLFHDINPVPRGSIRFTDSAAVIRLFRDSEDSAGLRIVAQCATFGNLFVWLKG